jgi:hypothetical protein
MAEFSYKEYEVRLLGRSVTTLKGLKWTWKDPKAFLKGQGNRAMGFVANGGGEGEGTLKIQQSDYVALVAAVKLANPSTPLIKLTDVTFDIVEAYERGTTLVSNKLLTCTIEEFNGGLDSGDPNLIVELKFKFLEVLENA